MLFYVRCPSCSRVIADRVMEWYIGTDKIRNDPQLNKKEKDEKTAELARSLTKHICCRMRIMGLIPYHEIVNTPSNRRNNTETDIFRISQ